MLKVKVLVTVLLVGLGVGCTPPFTTITGSGDVVTRDEEISGFDKVDVGHAFEADISQGESFSVIVRIDDNLLDELVLEKRGSTLKIGIKPGVLIRNATLEAEVTMPELVGLDLSGASHGTVTGFESTDYLDVDVSGASHLRGDIEAGDARFNASGASEVSLSGSGWDVTVDASGASTIDLSDFPVADARVDASGASKVTVDASGTLDAEASGASHVRYLGNPRLGRIDTSGASSVRPK
jgi:hypothetical protein